MLEWMLVIFYGLGLLCLSAFGFHRYLMVYLYRKYVSDDPVCPPDPNPWPFVTVQLPIYNEQHVVERLIQAIVDLDYPEDRLEIQILDDSDDETIQVIQRLLPNLEAKHKTFLHIRRGTRQGFKAGALDYGLQRARGDLIAIFDADFIPPRDFLKRTVPYFTDPTVGVVQVRWDYLNRAYSLLTRIESLMLDGHFVIEHAARYHSGRFFNFNGTGGVWRRTTIVQSGGWSHDTLTEDLDLSYRAQLQGWRFIYLKDFVVWSELPVEMAAFKQQQFRWAKGSMQTARKLIGTILHSSATTAQKIEALFHLTANFSYILMLWVGVLLGPSIWARYRLGLYQFLWLDIPIFCLATVSVASFYILSQNKNPYGFHRWYAFWLYIPMLMAVGIGLSVSNARAVWEGLRGIGSPFLRTPKYGISKNRIRTWAGSRYRLKQLSLPILELLAASLFLCVIYFCITTELWFSIPFVTLFLVGFSYTGALTLWQGWVFPMALRKAHVDEIVRQHS